MSKVTPLPPLVSIPTAITIGITARSSSRTRLRIRGRGRETIRVAVTYQLETAKGGCVDEPELARLIRHGVKATRRAYRLARTPAPLGYPASPSAPVVNEAEPNSAVEPGSTIEANPKEESKPHRRTITQLSTLEIMARQLGLTGKELSEMLSLRCNKTSLNDLSYRQAAALIASFSRLLRYKLEKEKAQEKEKQ